MEQKSSYGDIQKYTDIFFESASRMQFLGISNYAVQMFFSDTKQSKVGWEIFKVRKIFGCVARAYYFQCQVS